MKKSRFVAERKYDAIAVRNLITSEIKRCKKSRQLIAEQMTQLLGDRVTVRMLNSYTSEAAEQHRWPAQFDIAFCEVIGSYKLLHEHAKRAGLRLIGPKEERLIVIGAAYERKLAAEAILAAGGQ